MECEIKAQSCEGTELQRKRSILLCAFVPLRLNLKVQRMVRKVRMSKLRIIWKKSAIGYAKDQERAVKALGFHSLNDVVEHNDSPQIRGMIRKVRHLVEVEEIN